MRDILQKVKTGMYSFGTKHRHRRISKYSQIKEVIRGIQLRNLC